MGSIRPYLILLLLFGAAFIAVILVGPPAPRAPVVAVSAGGRAPAPKPSLVARPEPSDAPRPPEMQRAPEPEKPTDEKPAVVEDSVRKSMASRPLNSAEQTEPPVSTQPR
jgi:hypothetical protein